MQLQCDQCHQEFQKPFKQTTTEAKFHFCGQFCQNKANKNGNVLQKRVKETCIERYGVENPAQAPEVQARISATCLERFGVPSTVQSAEIQEKSRKTMQERYGVDFFTQHPEMPAKSQVTMTERYGVAHALQSQEFREKVSQTSLARFGVTHPMKSETVKNRVEQTCLEKYGVRHVMQSTAICEKSHSNQKSKFKRSHERFADKTFFCRSSYEQTFVRWCNSRQDLIKGLEANITTSYEFNGKARYYFIDFEVTLCNDIKLLIEIKPLRLVSQTLNQVKIEAGKRYAAVRGQKFFVVSENELNDLASFFTCTVC